MKAFAHWAIYRQQKIRIAGRSAGEIWGQVIGPDGTQRPFRFNQISLRLTLGEAGAEQVLRLDAYGFERLSTHHQTRPRFGAGCKPTSDDVRATSTTLCSGTSCHLLLRTANQTWLSARHEKR